MTEAADLLPDAAPEEPAEPAVPRARRHHRVAAVVGGVLAVLVLAGAWLAVQVYRAGTALADAKDRVDVMTGLVDDGDLAGLADALPPLRADLARARAAASDPVWSAALVVPWLGDQLGAVRTVAVALDDVAAAGEPLVTAVERTLGPDESGRLDLTPLIEAAPAVAAATGDLDGVADEVAAIDPARLVGPLAGPVTTLQEQFPRVADALGSASRLAGVLPAMLGADGPRSYAVALLNSAELRAQGGIVGSIVVLTADDGLLSLSGQHSVSSFGDLGESVLPLTDEELTVHGDRLGRWLQNAVETPDFPRAAQLVAARWAHETGEQVDGVVATDTTVVAGLLRATGPVDVDGVRLDADTAVDTLLRDTYARITDPAQSDAFFAQVAAAVFGAVADGQGDRTGVATALARAAVQNRLHAWSSHADEQRVLAGEQAGGAFLSGDAPDAIGVFLDDGTASKLGYYLRTTVSVEDLRCDADSPSATVRLDLDFRAPDDLAGLPAYVLGVSPGDDPPPGLQTNISVYSPVGTRLPSLGLGDVWVGGETYEVAGRQVQVITSRLAPGDHETYRAEVPLTDGSVTVWSTPTLTSPGTVTASCPSR